MAVSAFRLKLALQALAVGGLVGCPTEAVWGLSCDPQNREAIARLLALKQRSPAKGLILVAAESTQLEPLLHPLSEAERHKLTLSWPGATTWLIPHGGRVPSWISGGHDTVAVRVSAHPVLRELCQAWGSPLVSTSANPGGSQPATAGYQVRRYFGHQLDNLLPGAVGGAARPSIIRDLKTDQILRS